MSYMKVPSRVRAVKVLKPELRTRPVGLRLRPQDAVALTRLAARAGVGLSTFARLILEEYVRVRARKR